MRKPSVLPWALLLLCGCSQFFDLGKGGDLPSPPDASVRQAAAEFLPTISAYLNEAADKYDAGEWDVEGGWNPDLMRQHLEQRAEQNSQRFNDALTGPLSRVMPEGQKATKDPAVSKTLRQLAREVNQ